MTYYRIAAYLRFPKDREGHRHIMVSLRVLRPFEKTLKYGLETLYHIRPVTPEDLREFEIREGNGNDGCYSRGSVMAYDMEHAVAIAKREGKLSTGLRGVEWDGDDFTMHGDIHSSKLDYCPYSCTVTDVEKVATWQRAYRAQTKAG